MFERFTDRSRRVLVLAQEEARLLNHDFIGTEHLLLGLVDEGDGIAAQALQALGISLDLVRTAVEDAVGTGPARGQGPAGSPPFTPRAKKVLELALREALQLGHNYIGTEHMLLGLLREGEGVACRVLVGLGADLSRVRQEVMRLVSPQASALGARRGSRASGSVELVLGPRSSDQYVWALEQAGRRPEDYRIAFDALGRWLANRGRSIDELGSDDLLVESVGEGQGAGLRLSVRRAWLEGREGR